MVKEIKVFNESTKAHKTGNYPLFFGEESGLVDSINQPHPYLYDLMEKLKQLDWSEHDVDLTQTRMDLLKCDENIRKFMLYNLAYQWSLDSIATSIPTLLAPFVTNSEFGHLLARIGENECLHSVSYSNIVRQCVRNPQEVFDMVYEHEQVLDRSAVVGKALSELKKVGAEYTLGLITKEQAAPYVLKGVVAIYALERISFMSSFSCTFALAEQEVFVGAARLVQKILMDEMIHYEAGRYVLQDVLLKDPYWIRIFEDNKEDLSKIVEGVVNQETSWNSYLFSEGRSLVGLNEGLLNDWVRYNAQEVIDNLKLPQNFRKTKTCPLPWFEDNWMNLNNQQNANMEADATNYQVSSVSKDVSDLVLEDFDL
jgi:ribonucleotide reductase beta subunit family protein with ferritin-like domain